ncbi:hypothetical protein MMC07_009170 [Pseudocyphellaria aurata]|nr:hypothetical protein [Pseudocyphellaria aurata]
MAGNPESNSDIGGDAESNELKIEAIILSRVSPVTTDNVSKSLGHQDPPHRYQRFPEDNDAMTVCKDVATEETPAHLMGSK